MPTTNIPLALLLRCMAAEGRPNGPVPSLSVANRHSPHVYPVGSKQRPLFSLNRFCHIGVPLHHNYWFILGCQAEMMKGKQGVAKRGDRGEQITIEGQGGFHADSDPAAPLDWDVMRRVLEVVPLDRDWVPVQREPFANTSADYPYWMREDPVDDHCVVWMPLLSPSRGVGRPAPPSHVPKATKGPLAALYAPLPHGEHQAVALVVCNRAERAVDIIDMDKSITLTGAGSDATIWGLRGRLCEWLQVVCCDWADPYRAGRLEASLRARGYATAAGNPIRPTRTSALAVPSKAQLLERVALLEGVCREHGISY
jgi:hypothetical protein